MVSLTILAIGMLALMSMQTGALRANYNNQNLVVAQQVTMVAAEWVKAFGYTSLKAAEATPSDVFPVTGADSTSKLAANFKFSDLDAALAANKPNVWKPEFTRYVGVSVARAQDPNRDDVVRDYVIRLAVDLNYRGLDLGRVSATTFWEQDGEVVAFEILFIVDKKV